jgi:hypothetical protein
MGGAPDVGNDDTRISCYTGAQGADPGSSVIGTAHGSLRYDGDPAAVEADRRLGAVGEGEGGVRGDGGAGQANLHLGEPEHLF